MASPPAEPEPPALARGDQFDLVAFHAALEAQRVARRLSWVGVAREINRSFEDVVTARPLSASTMRTMLHHASVEGNCVLLMLKWLDRSPESFVPHHPLPDAPQFRLPDTPSDRILRWSPPSLYAALNAARQRRDLRWSEVANELGVFTPAMLTALDHARHVAFPRVMRLVTWLDQPAVTFMVSSPR